MHDEYSVLPPGTPVLVTGATGFTGQALVRKLCQQGASVRAIARASSNLGPLADLPIDWRRGDVFDPAVIKGAVDGVKIIFHVAAAYREAKITDDVYWNVHVKSTKELAAAALGTVERFVHVSTVGVHGHIDEPPADETYRFAPGDVYQRTKAEAEEWISGFAREQSLPLSVVRPAAIYGPGDQRLFKLFKLASKPIFPLFGSGEGLYHLVHVEDLTNIFIRAGVHPRAVGEVFIAGNEAPSRLEDVVRTIAEEIGNRSLRFIRLPAWPLFLAADVCEAICRPIGIEPPIYRRRVAFFTKDRAFNTHKLKEVLGYSQTIPTDTGLRATAQWYRAHGWF